MKSKPLTAIAVGRLSKPGRHAVGDGLYLQIGPAGTKAWLLRYMRDGQARQMGLGPFGIVSLADARRRALEARRLLLDHIDPIDARRGNRQDALTQIAKGMTFRQCAERYIAAHEPSWKNSKHKAQWKATLSTYAFPVFGSLSVAAIDVGLVMKVLEPIWTTKPETAGRVRGRIEVILDWARVRGHRDGENPARWKGHLDNLLPARGKVRRIKHHAALPYAELPSFMTALRAREGISARALEFVILTAARTGEAINARWAEIDGDVWAIPRDRMKGGREHRVPLPQRAIKILEALPREKDSEFVFPGARAGKPLSNMALLTTLRRMSRADLTAHGFRSTFRDWAAETTGHPSDVVEMALAHAVSSKVEAAYRRGDLFEKRRRLMEDWSSFAGSAGRAAHVIPLPSYHHG